MTRIVPWLFVIWALLTVAMIIKQLVTPFINVYTGG